MKHPKKRWLVPLLSVAVCAAVSLLAAWSDLTYNGGRLVYPMESYSFQRSDIPMLLALALDAFCALALLTFVLRQSILRRRREAETNRTRQLNPKLGFLGFFGFCGFLGFLPVSALSSYTPFVFFYFILLGGSRIEYNRLFGFIGVVYVLCCCCQSAAEKADKRYEYGENTIVHLFIYYFTIYYLLYWVSVD